jgi:hypothetical protein
MKMRLFVAAYLAAAAFASGSAACDIGRFPDAPERLKPDVIAFGRVDKLTITHNDPKTADRLGENTASAEIVIERTPLGETEEKSWRLDYPTYQTADFYACEIAEGPNLHEGNQVALYFKLVDGKLKLIDWFNKDIAVKLDPRLVVSGH